jgi:chemotaxis protein methyltransferase CheR
LNNFSLTFWNQFKAIVKTKTGLSLDSDQKTEALTEFLNRNAKLKEEGEERYLLYLGSLDNEEEWKRIIEAFNLSESYFFRDPNQLETIKRDILPNLFEKAKKSGKTLKIWSAGCSFGQEAYTLAILLDELASKENIEFQIIASDLQEESIRKSKEGIYSSWLIRGIDPSKVSQYFDELNSQDLKIKNHYRSKIHFFVLNLLSDFYPQDVDLIICRNVFIYFNTDVISSIVKKFRGALKEGGYLVAGHSELAGVPLEGWKNHSGSGSAFFEKSTNPSPTNSNQQMESSPKAAPINRIPTPSTKDLEWTKKEISPSQEKLISEKKSQSEYESFLMMAQKNEKESKNQDALFLYREAYRIDPRDPKLCLSIALLEESMGNRMEGNKFRLAGLSRIKTELLRTDIDKESIENWKRLESFLKMGL